MPTTPEVPAQRDRRAVAARLGLPEQALDNRASLVAAIVDGDPEQVQHLVDTVGNILAAHRASGGRS